MNNESKLQIEIKKGRSNPIKYINDHYDGLTFTSSDDNDVLVCIMILLSFNNRVDDFLRVISTIESLGIVSTNLEYAFYYNLALATFYNESKSHDSAIKYSLKTIDIAYQLNDFCEIVRAYRYLSSIYLRSHDFENALYYAEIAITELRRCDNDFVEINAYNHYGVVLVSLERYSHAKKAYIKALELIKKQDNFEEDNVYCLIMANLGELSLLTDDNQKAFEYYDIALKLTESHGHVESFENMLLMLASHLKESGNFEKSCHYYAKYIKLKNDNISNSVVLSDDSSEIKENLSRMRHISATNRLLIRRLSQLQEKIPLMTIKDDEKLVEDLTQALSEDRIVTYFQSKYSLRSNKIVGAEALIRWVDGDKVVPPSAFIPMIENSPIILYLSRKVINDSIKLCKSVVQDGFEDFVVSINIAPYQFEHDDLASFIANELFINDLEAKHIELELTERTFFNQTTKSIEQISALLDLGISLSLDDFGSGYSSLSNIIDNDFNSVKLDRTLLRNIEKDAKVHSLLSGLLKMFKEINLVTVVEGVENEEMESVLKELHCDYVQGFLYDHPVEQGKFLSQMSKEKNSFKLKKQRSGLYEKDIK